jgi:hypothetical protein
MQVRLGCTVGFGEDVRDLQRTLQDSFPNIESVSTMGLPGHDGCHFLPEGYIQLGDQLFRLLARDFYSSRDNDQISSPNILQAYYANSVRTRIGLTFTPEETRFIIPADTVIGGIPASIKDYFFLDDASEVVQSVSTSRNRIFLDLIQSSSSRFINYLPDKYYNHTSAIYEGPWLENERGVGAFSFYHIPIVDSAHAGILPTNLNDYFSLNAYPNPSNGKFIVRYSIPQDEQVTLSLIDVLGREILSKSRETWGKGEHQDMFDANILGLPDGMYICKVQIKDTLRMVSVTVKR